MQRRVTGRRSRWSDLTAGAELGLRRSGDSKGGEGASGALTGHGGAVQGWLLQRWSGRGCCTSRTGTELAEQRWANLGLRTGDSRVAGVTRLGAAVVSGLQRRGCRCRCPRRCGWCSGEEQCRRGRWASGTGREERRQVLARAEAVGDTGLWVSRVLVEQQGRGAWRWGRSTVGVDWRVLASGTVARRAEGRRRAWNSLEGGRLLAR